MSNSTADSQPKQDSNELNRLKVELIRAKDLNPHKVEYWKLRIKEQIETENVMNGSTN